MKIVLGIVFFLALGAFFIISNYNLALSNEKSMPLFKMYYGQWIDSLLHQFKGLTGYVVHSDWLPPTNHS